MFKWALSVVFYLAALLLLVASVFGDNAVFAILALFMALLGIGFEPDGCERWRKW